MVFSSLVSGSVQRNPSTTVSWLVKPIGVTRALASRSCSWDDISRGNHKSLETLGKEHKSVLAGCYWHISVLSFLLPQNYRPGGQFAKTVLRELGSPDSQVVSRWRWRVLQ